MNYYAERDRQHAIKVLRNLLPRWAWPLLDLVMQK